MVIFWVVILTVFFAVLHSILARLAIKSRVRAVVGNRRYEAFYRIVYNVLSVITFAPIFGVLYLYPGADVWSMSGAIAIVFRILQLIGLLGLGASLLQIDGGRFLGTKQVQAYLNDAPLPLPDEPLQTGGVYAIVRHPLYLFSLMVLWFTPSMSTSWFAFVVLSTIYFAVGSIFEERTMIEIFGEPYKAYQQDVPWLIPFVK